MNGLLILLALAAGTQDPKKQAERLPDGQGIENLARINPFLYRGAQPTRESFARLKEMGIKTVINLRQNHDDQDEGKESDLKLVDIPMHASLTGSTAPSDADVKKFFETVLDPANQPVYFHCAHGKDRTGTMAALWRIEMDGWTAEEAMAEMKAFGYHTIYEDLIAFVRKYKPRGFGRFSDAAAIWQMAEPGRLTVRGAVALGVKIEGGDGLAARFDGGYLDAGDFTLTGPAMTLAIRLRDPSGAWNCPILSEHGGHDKLVFNLFSHDFGRGMELGFEMGTTGNKGLLRTSVPLAAIGPTDWHEVICRSDGAKLEMFVDGRCVDEDFPLGTLRGGNPAPLLIGAEATGTGVKAGFRGLIDHAALWNRALSDAEVAAGKPRTEPAVAPPSLQYWRPPNNFFVGDCLPFFHDGTFHFLYLLDRNHHQSKNGLGAHQWAQATSKDLVNWTHHPLAIPITEQWEGSICTGSVFHHEKTYYGFYATRKLDGTQHLAVAASPDGIRYAKQKPNPLYSPPAGYDPAHFRDPTVFAHGGLFHLLVTARLTAHGGCLARLTSPDLKTWELQEPFLVTGDVPECPDLFEWNGRHYLVYSPRGVAVYRMADSPMGPWTKPAVEVFGSPLERVAKTAAFTGNRRLSASFLAERGYAGRAIFRELVQNPEGTLGTKFVAEMEPPDALRIACRVKPGAGPFVLSLHGTRISFDPAAGTVKLGDEARIEGVTGLDRPFGLEVVLKDDIVDLCIDKRRTLIGHGARRSAEPIAADGGALLEGVETRLPR